MGQTLKVARGFDRTWSSQLRNGGVPTPYPPEAAFDASVSRGDGEPTLFSPTAAWIDSSEATFRVSVSAAQTVGLESGLYRMQAGVTSGGIRSLAFDGYLEILGTPGSVGPRSPYVEMPDLELFYSQVIHLQTPEDDTNFLTHRSRASDEFDIQLVRRYDPVSGMSKTRRTTPHPLLGLFDVHDPASAWPTPGELAVAVRAGGVVVDEVVREMVSKLALNRILGQQQTAGGRGDYRDEADRFRREAMALWREYDIRVDTTSPLDGTADLLIGRELILLPLGTAP